MSEATFLYSVGNSVRNSLIRRVPVDTGELKNSISFKVDGKGISFFMSEHGLYVEHGTKPHLITPKVAKSLHFKSGGQDVFAKVVHHPGTRPQPFIRNTFYHDLPRILRSSALKHLGDDITIEVSYYDDSKL